MDTPEAEYRVTVGRQIVLKDAEGEVLQVVDDHATALRLLPGSQFKSRRSFTAAEANPE